MTKLKLALWLLLGTALVPLWKFLEAACDYVTDRISELADDLEDAERKRDG